MYTIREYISPRECILASIWLTRETIRRPDRLEHDLVCLSLRTREKARRGGNTTPKRFSKITRRKLLNVEYLNSVKSFQAAIDLNGWKGSVQWKGLFAERRFKRTGKRERGREREREERKNGRQSSFCIFSKSFPLAERPVGTYSPLRSHSRKRFFTRHALFTLFRLPERRNFLRDCSPEVPTFSVRYTSNRASLDWKISRGNSTRPGSRPDMLPANVSRVKLFGKWKCKDIRRIQKLTTSARLAFTRKLIVKISTRKTMTVEKGRRCFDILLFTSIRNISILLDAYTLVSVSFLSWQSSWYVLHAETRYN